MLKALKTVIEIEAFNEVYVTDTCTVNKESVTVPILSPVLSSAAG